MQKYQIEDLEWKINKELKKINNLARNHNLVQEVINCETSFKKTVNEYEEEFFKLLKKGKKEEVEAYQKNFFDLFEILKEFNTNKFFFYSTKSDINIVDYKKQRRKGRISGSVALGGYATNISSILVSTIFPPLGLAMAAGGCIAFFIGWSSWIGTPLPRRLRKKYKESFNELKQVASKTDTIIQETHMLHYYTKEINEVFKQRFPQMTRTKQRYAINKILNIEKRNPCLDDWLSKQYFKIIKEEGTDLIK